MASTICTELMYISSWWMANTGMFMHESIRKHCLWVCPYISSSAQHVLFILHWWFVRWVISGSTAAFLWGATFRICWKQHTESLYSYHLAFSPSVSLKSKWCNHTVVLTQVQLRMIPFLFYQRDQSLHLLTLSLYYKISTDPIRRFYLFIYKDVHHKNSQKKFNTH